MAIQLLPLTIEDRLNLQNIARLYVYDMSRYCGFISDEWALPTDGLYESYDFKCYIEDPARLAFFITINQEHAGFVLLHQESLSPTTRWVMGEFFILAKFQGRDIGHQVTRQLWTTYPGIWEVSVIPENKNALRFWRDAIGQFTHYQYKEELKKVAYDNHQPQRHILTFDTASSLKQPLTPTIQKATIHDVPVMVALSHQKRLVYEKAQPQFWKYAGSHAEVVQAKWFEALLTQGDHLLFAAKEGDTLVGFIIGKLVAAPDVYDPGGLTLMIDDFCVAHDGMWLSVGTQLIHTIKQAAKAKGAAQIVVVCGAHDAPKRRFLQHAALTIASEWYVGDVIHSPINNHL